MRNIRKSNRNSEFTFFKYHGCLYFVLNVVILALQGKSLSIICGALRWLCDHDIRNKNDLKRSIELMEKELANIDSNASDDWLTTQSKEAEINRSKAELQSQLRDIEENDEQIQKIKESFQNVSKYITSVICFHAK